ncbi:DNA repair protein, putative [Trypanosoma equiperdum]|uniref:DNA repair protein, putative n=1 Tax=Trypanosoma equiperdum TaxID=5694 RepID=A0A1G4HZN7_TRYEQ|nr:DNA repair protein, putative [Trypanosoma equiperdum]
MPQTVSSRIAECCTAADSDGGSAQLCVVSIGFDIECITANIVRRVVEACNLPSPNACVSCVVLPDGTGDSVLLRVASTLTRILSNNDSTVRNDNSVAVVNVHAVLEGTMPRQRCTYYQSGGIVVLCSRVLCADLLHRRVARELIGCVVVLLRRQRVDGIAHTVGFCAEILLRGGGPLLLPTHRKHPPFVLLSDDPFFVRYAIQHPRVRQEPFLVQVRVDNVLLFPRFRLDIMRHFENVASQRPLIVDRFTVNMARTTYILDDLLCKVIMEIVTELHEVCKRMGPSGCCRNHSCFPNSNDQAPRNAHKRGASNTRSGIADGDEPHSRLDPLSQRQRLDHCSGGQPNGSPPGYSRKPWVVSAKRAVINFAGILYENAININDRSLDDDLHYALRTHDTGWPYGKLCESLIDLRKLRRIVRSGSPYAAVLELEELLMERTPRFAGPSLRTGWATVQHPDALWTLSQHFSSITKLFVYRIGEVKEVSNTTPQCGGCTSRTYINVDTATPASVEDEDSSKVIVIDGDDTNTDSGTDDDDDDDNDDVLCVSEVRPKRFLVPRVDEVDPCMELTNRLTMNWGRDAHRKQVIAASALSSDDPLKVKPRVLMVVVFGRMAFQRYSCRLAYSLADFQALDLDCFVTMYQGRHGAKQQRYTQNPTPEASDAAKLRTWFFHHKVESVDDDVEHKAGEGADDDTEKQGGLDNSTTFSKDPSFLFSDKCSVLGGPRGSDNVGLSTSTDGTSHLNESGRNCGHNGVSLHRLIMKQGQSLSSMHRSQGGLRNGSDGPTDAVTASAAPGSSTCILKFDYARDSVARLTFHSCEGDSSPSALPLHVAVVDGNKLCVSSLVEFIKGTHSALTPDSTDDDGAPADSLRVVRIIVVEQQLRFMRMLEMAQDVLSPQHLKNLRVQVLVERSPASSSAPSSQTGGGTLPEDPVVAEEQEAFAALAHAKATLPATLIADRNAVRLVEERLDSAVLDEGRVRRGRRPSRNGLTLLVEDENTNGISAKGGSGGAPLVVFDEREFRSRLPYELYCRGIDLVPLTLLTGDYVLSPTYALERKSLLDFIHSLHTGRVNSQLSRLSRSYDHPMLLIEFDRSTPFRLSFGLAGSVGEHSETGLFSRIARIFTSFPRVHVIWTRDATQSASFIHSMKRTCASESIDPSAPYLTCATVDYYCPAGAKESSHYATRVLSCFPGVTPKNLQRVMALCGSLAGLGTVEEEALAGVMGSAAARELYAFIHGESVPPTQT